MRSHTDTLTNVVVLSAIDIADHFQEIVDRDLPILSLPTFLHEATHHWCLDTPVGLALHLLFMRARRAAIVASSSEGSGQDEWDVLDNVVRFEVARDTMRPLSEGIALFMEHDAVPGHAKTISTPMMRASGLYARGFALSGSKPYEGLPLILAGARVSRHHTRQKAALLLGPMTSGKGGYLPGYFLVKGLWRIAYVESDLFQDADFFAQYLRGHFFDDWELVSKLLDSSTKDVGAMGPIAQHISSRVAQFVEVGIKGDNPRNFETLSEHGATQKLELETDLVKLDIPYLRGQDSPEARLGRSRLEEGLREHFAGWTGDPVHDELLNFDRIELAQRSVISLGSAVVDAEPVAKGLQLSIKGQALATIASSRFPDGAATIVGATDLELITFDRPGSLCFALSQNNQHVATVPIGTMELPDLLKETLVTSERRSHQVSLSADAIDAALAKADLVDALVASRKSLQEALEDWLIPTCLMDVRPDRLDNVRHQMKTNGLLNILGDDLPLLIDTAVASICIPSPYTFGSVESFHQWSAPTPQEAILKLSKLIIGTLGFSPFIINDDYKFKRVSFI